MPHDSSTTCTTVCYTLSISPIQEQQHHKICEIYGYLIYLTVLLQSFLIGPGTRKETKQKRNWQAVFIFGLPIVFAMGFEETPVRALSSQSNRYLATLQVHIPMHVSEEGCEVPYLPT